MRVFLSGDRVRTISEFVFDLAQNSITAKSRNVHIKISEDISANLFELTMVDDGIGIREENLHKVKSPFFTTRPHSKRRVGMGLSLMDAACTLSGGELLIESGASRGVSLQATMMHDNIDRPPLGDIADVFTSLLISSVENRVLWKLEHGVNGKGYHLTNRRTLDELNMLSFAEPGVREALYGLILRKEDALRR